MTNRYPYRHHGPAVHGSKLTDYLISEANMIEDLEQLRAENARLQARVDDLTEALRPFAQMLERYNLDDHELISICNDFTGQRLNVSHRECWNLARAALKELENTDDRS